MFAVILLLSSTFLSQTSDSSTKAPTDRTAQTETSNGKAAAATPEQALRTFLAAMITQDEKSLRAVTLPAKDLEWLLKGKPVPADLIENIKSQIANQPIRVLKPGDVITLPGNRKLTVQPDEVTKDRAFLLPEGMELPSRLRKVDGRWRVDATPMIAARKAAEAVRKKANARKR